MKKFVLLIAILCILPTAVFARTVKAGDALTIQDLTWLTHAR